MATTPALNITVDIPVIKKPLAPAAFDVADSRLSRFLAIVCGFYCCCFGRNGDDGTIVRFGLVAG